MAKIALIKCSSPAGFNLLISPPLGLMYLAAVIQPQGHQVKIFASRFHPDNDGRLEKELRDFEPDYIGLSAMVPEMDSFHRWARIACGLPGVRAVVGGGPYATAMPFQAMEDRNIDALVLGEGEISLSRLLKKWEEPGAERGSEIPGVLFRKDEGLSGGNFPDPIPDLDRIPFPAWDLINLDSYRRHKWTGNPPQCRYIHILTSRGCPYRCSYCHQMFGKIYRARTAENVVDEIGKWQESFQVEQFEVIDDIFNLDRDRVLKICRLLRERGLKIKLSFPNGLRGDLLDEETLGQLKSVGTYWINFGVETASPRLQKLIGKNLNSGALKKNIEICRKLRIITHGFFILGFPTETRAEVEMTIRSAREFNLDFASFFQLIPFPGFPLAGEFGKDERQPGGISFCGLDYYGEEVNLSQASNQELSRLRRRAYLEFYLYRIPRILIRGHWRKVSLSYGLRQFWHRAVS